MKDRIDGGPRKFDGRRRAASASRARHDTSQADRGSDTLDEVVVRMRAMDEASGNSSYCDGHRAGDEWARREAGPVQLRSLACAVDMSDGKGEGDTDIFVDVAAYGGRKHGVVKALARAMDRDWNRGRQTARAFCEGLVGDEVDRLNRDYDFAIGFVEGALEVWAYVVPRL